MLASLINGFRMLIRLVREALMDLIVSRACAMSSGGIGLSVVRPILNSISNAFLFTCFLLKGYRGVPSPGEFCSGWGSRRFCA